MRVGTVGADLEVEPALQPEGAHLERGVRPRCCRSAATGSRRRARAAPRAPRPRRDRRGPRRAIASLRSSSAPASCLEHARQVLVARRPSIVQRDLVVGATGVVDRLGRPPDHRLERLLERVAAVAGGVAQACRRCPRARAALGAARRRAGARAPAASCRRRGAGPRSSRPPRRRRSSRSGRPRRRTPRAPRPTRSAPSTEDLRLRLVQPDLARDHDAVEQLREGRAVVAAARPTSSRSAPS